MKYPKMPFEENNARKLDDAAIAEIRSVPFVSVSLLSKKYGVSKNAILYHRMSDEKRKEMNRKRHLNHTPEERRRANRASYLARKKLRAVARDEYNAANRVRLAEDRVKRPEIRAAQQKRYVQKHPEAAARFREKHPHYARDWARKRAAWLKEDPLRILIKTRRQVSKVNERS